LSIIDLEHGAQPLFSEERDLVLVCNGELYGFEEIREGLQARGHRFSTGSDSEIILHLYQEHGLDFVRHLRGEFAFSAPGPGPA
jgi:asparagine synthase (glutamine-hydrolysing)